MNAPSEIILIVVSVGTFCAGYFLISWLLDIYKKKSEKSEKIVHEPAEKSVEITGNQESPRTNTPDFDDKVRKYQKNRDAKWEKYRRPNP